MKPRHNIWKILSRCKGGAHKKSMKALRRKENAQLKKEFK